MESDISQVSHPTFHRVDYRALLLRLDSMLQDGHPLTNLAYSTTLYNIHASWLKIRVWASDIDQEKTDILGRLRDLSQPLAAKVRLQLDSIDKLLSELEDRIANSEDDRRELEKLAQSILNSTEELSRLTESLIDVQDNDNNGMAAYVQQALKKQPDNFLHQVSASLKPQENTNVEIKFEVTDRSANIPPSLDTKSSPGLKPARISSPFHQGAVHYQDLTDFDKNVEFTMRDNSLQSSSPLDVQKRPFTIISKDEVRLATIHPGDSTEPLEISIFTIKIFDLPKYKYEALSYAWNFLPTDVWQTILIRDQNTGLTVMEPSLQSSNTLRLQIRQDTYRALKKLRNDEIQVIIWVDAVCVDLANVEEKRIQSANFAEIFYHASLVILWLGDSDNVILEAFDLAERVFDYDRTESNAFLDPEVSSRIGSLTKLFANKVFSRRWIVQEIVLAQNVALRCGDKILDWARFEKALSYWVDIRYLKPRVKRAEIDRGVYLKSSVIYSKKLPVEIILEIRARWIVREKSSGLIIESLINLNDLVVIFSGFSSINPKDAIYAFVSIAGDTAKFIPPDREDLNSSRGVRCVEVGTIWTETFEMDVLETFLNFIQHSIDKLGSLDILCFSWAPINSGPLPSWMKETDKLEKSRNPTMYNFAKLNKEKEGAYDSTNNMEPVYQIKRKSNDSSKSRFLETPLSSGVSETAVFSLLVEGISLGFIGESSPRMARGLITRECLELGGLDFSSQETSPQQYDIPEMLWRTLVADRASNGDRAPYKYQELLTECLNKSIDGDLETGVEWHMDYTDEEIEFLRTVHDVTYNRKLFRFGDDERLGLGPAEMEVGDMVCVLFGCSVPVVLRERLAGIAPYFEFIGECFVYGVMEGEWLRELGAKELKRKTREFEIR